VLESIEVIDTYQSIAIKSYDICPMFCSAPLQKAKSLTNYVIIEIPVFLYLVLPFVNDCLRKQDE